MTGNGYLQIGFYLAALLLFAWPLGIYMASIYQGDIPLFIRWLRPVERGLYRLAGVSDADQMHWTRYAVALLIFNLLGLVVVYALQRLQGQPSLLQPLPGQELQQHLQALARDGHGGLLGVGAGRRGCGQGGHPHIIYGRQLCAPPQRRRLHPHA